MYTVALFELKNIYNWVNNFKRLTQRCMFTY